MSRQTRARFPKPVYQYEAIDAFGRNIVTTEDEVWNRHRKIVAPAFSEVCLVSTGTLCVREICL
jgi:cytochrome P450